MQCRFHTEGWGVGGGGGGGGAVQVSYRGVGGGGGGGEAGRPSRITGLVDWTGGLTLKIIFTLFNT